MGKRAYITDLDGTLLRSDQTLSGYTIGVLSNALAQDVVVSFATARGYISAHSVVSAIPWKYPLILYNGALLYDGLQHTVIGGYWLENTLTDRIFEIGRAYGIMPFYFSLDADSRERVLHEELKREGETAFFRSRMNDPRFVAVDRLACPVGHRTLAITYIGRLEELKPIEREVAIQLGGQVHSHMMKDYYIADHYFLEFSHPQANKREGLKLWARHMNIQPEDIVAFGDHVNDLGLFEAAGRKIAVRNAQDAIKRLADEIVPSNDEDGVAAYLERETGAEAAR